MDDPGPPAEYGESRLVLLVVDPYLIHAYWKVAPDRLREVKKRAVQGQGVLRFYRLGSAASGDVPPDSFDVEIDLQAPNWYVRLWCPEESLYADLALRIDDRTFIQLARSQVVHMPRNRPALATDQHFMRVEASEHRVELVPPPPVDHDRRESQVPRVELPQVPPPQQQVAAATVSDENIPGPILKPFDFAEVVREALQKVFATARWRGSRHEPETAAAEGTSALPTGAAGADLTEIAEARFPSSLSSSALQKNSRESEPETPK